MEEKGEKLRFPGVSFHFPLPVFLQSEVFTYSRTYFSHRTTEALCFYLLDHYLIVQLWATHGCYGDHSSWQHRDLLRMIGPPFSPRGGRGHSYSARTEMQYHIDNGGGVLIRLRFTGVQVLMTTPQTSSNEMQR